MTKHSMFRTDLPPKPAKLPMHPIWRGIGLILMVVLPVGSYLFATMLIENKDRYSWVIIPTDIVLNRYPNDPLILVRLLYALIILLAVAAVLAFFTFLMSSLFGPSKYDPYDAPPER
jgi:hypothetical protein